MLVSFACIPATSCRDRINRIQSLRILFATTLVLIALTPLAGCSPNRMLARAVADQLATQAQDQEDDIQLARDAAPFFLKLGESVLARYASGEPILS